MTKILCTSERRPWIDGKPRQMNETVEVTADVAKIALATGFFEAVKDVSKGKDSSGGQQSTDSPKPRSKRNTKRDS